MEDLGRLRDLALSDTGFVFDPHTGTTYSVNTTGLAILRSLKDGLERSEVLASLHDGFEITQGDVERDLDEFVQLLRHNGLVAKDFEP